jgi:hypothetical protein
LRLTEVGELWPPCCRLTIDQQSWPNGLMPCSKLSTKALEVRSTWPRPLRSKSRRRSAARLNVSATTHRRTATRGTPDEAARSFEHPLIHGGRAVSCHHQRRGTAYRLISVVRQSEATLRRHRSDPGVGVSVVGAAIAHPERSRLEDSVRCSLVAFACAIKFCVLPLGADISIGTRPSLRRLSQRYWGRPAWRPL